MHGTLTEAGDEADGQHVKITLQEPVETVFCHTVLSGLVLNHLLANIFEASLYRQHGYVTVHLAVDFYAPDHLPVICLQPAVEVVQPDAGKLPGSVVVKLRCCLLDERIIPLLLPSGDQMIPLFPDHPDQFGDLIGTVLQVGIHGYHHIS